MAYAGHPTSLKTGAARRWISTCYIRSEAIVECPLSGRLAIPSVRRARDDWTALTDVAKKCDRERVVTAVRRWSAGGGCALALYSA